MLIQLCWLLTSSIGSGSVIHRQIRVEIHLAKRFIPVIGPPEGCLGPFYVVDCGFYEMLPTAYQTGPSVSRPAEVLHRGFTSGHLLNGHVSLLCLGSNDTTRIVVLALYDHFVCQKLSSMSCQRHLRQMAGWEMRQIPLPATLLLWYDESIALRR